MTVFAGFDGVFKNDVWVLTNANGAIDVAIDIKPATIALRRRGPVPVAIVSSATFNAPAVVNTASVRFGRIGNEASALSCQIGDANSDGLLDLICTFSVQETGFQVGDTMGS